MIGVAADSGCGKSTFLRRILGALGTEVKPGHTAIGDMMTVICLDDYHINDRAGRKATGLTALDTKENDFELMDAQMSALKAGKAIYKPIYNHDTGFKDAPELIEPNKVVVIEGLHPIMDEGVRAQLDLGIYIDIVDEVKFAWKVQRDVAERGWTEEQVQEDIQKRLPDFSAYVDPQKANADVILRYEPSDKGLPFLKVKLIQKKGGAFPMITLKKDLTLTGSEPGATLKMYDDDWFGNAVTVVEMDGEIDMENMEAQLKEIEENIEGLNAKSAGELTEAMVKLTKDEKDRIEKGKALLEYAETWLEKAEIILRKSPSGWYAGNSLSYADIAMEVVLFFLRSPDENAFKGMNNTEERIRLVEKFKLVKANNDRVRRVPEIAKWLDNRPSFGGL